MRVDPSTLAARIGRLDPGAVQHGLEASVQELLRMVRQLIGVDGTGLMLVDQDGRLRWAAASDPAAEHAETEQEHHAEGPCSQAFAQRAPVLLADAEFDAPAPIRAVLLDADFLGAASVPVELGGGPIGTLDAYTRGPAIWHDSQVSALQACAGVLANLLGSVALAQANGQLAGQLQTALDHRILIEQAKGVLMERDGLDQQTAFERLRAAARVARLPIVELAQDVIAGKPLPPSQVEVIREQTQAVRAGRLAAAGEAAVLHERIAGLYEQLGRYDMAARERDRAAQARARHRNARRQAKGDPEAGDH